jgi:release factor glutamine methyltransferase
MTGGNPYLDGRTRFLDVDLLIAPGALVPREETELLGRTALELLSGLQSHDEVRLIDMCCGSGNLACGIAKNKPGARVWAADLTDGAVAVARANVDQLSLGDRVTVVQGDLFAPLSGMGLEGTIDLIVCNPPYISTGKLATERAELLSHEPREAFDGGPYGVSIFQRVVRDAVAYLKPSGVLAFEVGVGQERQVSMLFDRSRSYEAVMAISDAAGQPRVLVGRKKTLSV